MLKKSFVVGFFVVMSGLAGTAQAQDKAAPGSKKELVAKVVKLQQPVVEGLARNLAEQPAVQMMQQAGVALQTKVAADKRDAVAKEIQGDLKKYVDEAVPIVREHAVKLAPSTIGPVLEEKLNEAELRKVIAILESMEAPAFRKFQQAGADMQRALLDKLVAETRPLVEPKVKDLNASIAKRLGVAPEAAPAAPAVK